MSKTAITSPELAPPVGPFPRRSKSVVSSISAVSRPRPGHWQGSRGGHCGRDGARLPESLGGSQGGRKEFRSRCARRVYLTSMMTTWR